MVKLVIAISLATVLLMVVTTDQAEAVCVYQVQAGDYCIKIQEEFGVYSLDRFYAMNPGVDYNCDNLRVGQIVTCERTRTAGLSVTPTNAEICLHASIPNEFVTACSSFSDWLITPILFPLHSAQSINSVGDVMEDDIFARIGAGSSPCNRMRLLWSIVFKV